MIPTSAQTSVNRAGGVLRTENMRIDTASLPHLMTVLTNLYSNPRLAVIREYSTNAMDSHVAAGKPELPIKVTLPTREAPNFVVQDFGLGLSQEEVFEIYGAYGASTKRTSNDFTGQLGLGCKSALTYASQFVLTAVKDGKRNVFSIHKDDKGVPNITQLSSTDTDLTNGVTVSIPVLASELSNFEYEAGLFYRYWKVLPEFTNGEPVDGAVSFGLKLTERVYLSGSTGSVPGVIVMGGVPYPTPEIYGAVIFAEVGDVDFVPSREALHYTKRTRTFLTEVKDEIAQAAAELVGEALRKATDYIHGLEILRSPEIADYSLEERAGRPFHMKDEMGVLVPISGRSTTGISGKVYGKDGFVNHQYFRPGSPVKYYVEGFPSSYFIRKIREYCRLNNTRIMLVERGGEVIPARLRVEHAEIDKIKLSNGTVSTHVTVVDSSYRTTRRLKDNVSYENVVYATRAEWRKVEVAVKGMSSHILLIPNLHLPTKTQVKEYSSLEGATHLHDWLNTRIETAIEEVRGKKTSLARFVSAAVTQATVGMDYNVRWSYGGNEELQLLRELLDSPRPSQEVILAYHLSTVGYKHTLLTELSDRIKVLETEIKKAAEVVRKEYPMLFSTQETVQAYINNITEGKEKN